MKFSREQIDEILTDPKYQLLAEGIKKLKNINGYTPQKGVDFFTEKDVEDISDYIEKSGRNIKITNDVTGFVEKVIEKIKVENNTDLTPLLKSLEKIHSKLSEKPTEEKEAEVDYTDILNEIKRAIPQVKENPLIQDISDTLNDFVIRFDKLLTENNRLRVEVDRVGGGGGGGGGVLPKGVLNASDVRINPATEETLQSILAASGGSVYNYILSETTGTYKYYGFTSSTGYQVKRKTLATGVWEVATGTYPTPYADFDAAWAARASLTYAYV